MKNKSILIGALLCAANQTASAEVTFSPRVFAGVMDYEFSINSSESGANFFGDRVKIGEGRPQTVSDTLTLIGIGGTLSFAEGIFTDIYYQQSNEGEDEDEHNGNPDVNLDNVGYSNFEREDYAVAIGKSFSNGFAVSLGYKEGETEFNQDFTNGGPPHRTTQVFNLSGPFVGLSYGLSVGPGVLGFNLGIADLNGEFDVNFRNLEKPKTGIRTSLSGDATGETFGVSWKAPINDNWLYAVSADTYKYDFKIDGIGRQDNSADTATTVGPVAGELEEKATRVLIALTYRF